MQGADSRINPDEVVALGAAVQAGLIARDASVEDLVVTDVAPFTLGIRDQQTVRHRAQVRVFSAHHSPQHHDSRQPGRARGTVSQPKAA